MMRKKVRMHRQISPHVKHPNYGIFKRARKKPTHHAPEDSVWQKEGRKGVPGV